MFNTNVLTGLDLKLGLLIALLFVGNLDSAALAAPRVQFELVTEAGFPLAGAQRWVELFRKLGQTGIRIRSARAGDRVDVANRGTADAPRYYVLGVLTAGNRLLLPGRKPLTLSDRAAISSWIQALQQDGIEGLTAVRLAFGLTADELVAIHDQLAKPIRAATLNVRAGDVARRIVRDLAVPFHVTAAGRSAFRRHEPVLDELQGLSGGTALAAVLRPLGLVMAPQKQSGEVRLFIGRAGEVTESWPVGWPLKDSPAKTAPALFRYVPVQIEDQPLSLITTAIQSQVKLPFLYDRNTMARDRIDPDQATVSYPDSRTFYKKVLDNILFQARLRSELKIDDAGTPFLWISSSKR